MSQYLGDISAYALAVSQGYTGTEEEYAELMASYADVGQTAVDAKDAALAAKTAAQTAATTATNKASEATTAATTATNKAAEAQADADAAALDASQALSAASTATTKATEATTAAATATSAKTDAVAANTAAQSAKTAAQTAQTGAETAAASVQSSAAQIATNTEDIESLKSELTALAPKEDMYKAFPTDTASGAVASFADGANVPVKSLIVNIDPVQSGSGDPSPTNVRPISGWSEVNVSHSGADMTNPTVISIQLGQTVYGGTLDVTNGVLTVDRILFNMTSIQANAISNIDASGKSFIFLVPVKAISYVATENGIISNRYKGVTYTTEFNDSIFMSNASLLSIKSSTVIGTTASEIVEYFAGHDTVISYRVADPTTIQLDPHEVTALLGSNNVWADSGNSEVVYRADPTLYIQRLTEPDADMVADANIVSGQYFMVGNTLYKATANIASGATISPNVNCTRKSLSEALNELNA